MKQQKLRTAVSFHIERTPQIDPISSAFCAGILLIYTCRMDIQWEIVAVFSELVGAVQ